MFPRKGIEIRGFKIGLVAYLFGDYLMNSINQKSAKNNIFIEYIFSRLEYLTLAIRATGVSRHNSGPIRDPP